VPAHSHSHGEAAAQDLVRALRRCGVLTRDGLREAAGAEHWQSGAFEIGIKHGVQTGQIRALTPDLFELGDGQQT
jgi:hypothetical protein